MVESEESEAEEGKAVRGLCAIVLSGAGAFDKVVLTCSCAKSKRQQNVRVEESPKSSTHFAAMLQGVQPRLRSRSRSITSSYTSDPTPNPSSNPRIITIRIDSTSDPRSRIRRGPTSKRSIHVFDRTGHTNSYAIPITYLLCFDCGERSQARIRRSSNPYPRPWEDGIRRRRGRR